MHKPALPKEPVAGLFIVLIGIVLNKSAENVSFFVLDRCKNFVRQVPANSRQEIR